MTLRELLSHCDHTALSPTTTWDDIRALCDDGMTYGVASVCIPPAYIHRAKAYVGDRLPLCTVIGFPNGYMTTEAKIAEAADALRCGADEIDMVIHIGALKEGRYDDIEQEIRRLKGVCREHILKVIVETCLLTEEEKIRIAQVVSRSGADYIKTSTGFSTGGATPEDVRLLRAHTAPHVKVKAAGGIASIKDAEEFIRLGADRLGTSRLVNLAKQQGL
ncbi:MAG: deoxyribose-phosphate aldolase [Clostridia bacterium]|nr:deoxyribose-phosphate aldolase [Clostridia bacterium]